MGLLISLCVAPGLTVEACVTQGTKGHFNMKTIYWMQDSPDERQNSSPVIFAARSAPGSGGIISLY